MEPLASRLRPLSLDQVLGQRHLLGPNKVLSGMIRNHQLMNLLFYGPPGTGKTTVARLLADVSNRRFVMLNGSTDSLKDVREVLNETQTMMGFQGLVLYIDEIHLFNKRNQQILLDYIEDGRILLIGATTENPHFAVFKALVSRCVVVEFRALSPQELKGALDRGLKALQDEYHLKELSMDEGLRSALAHQAQGDARRALNLLEAVFLSRVRSGESSLLLTGREAEDVLGRPIGAYDSDGDVHFDLLSAFHKSVRGSDPDASVVYLAQLLKGGDLLALCRRLLCIASEDVGLAYPLAIPIVKACVDSALQLGLPEAMLPLVNAVVLLATAPKSSSAPESYWAVEKALSEKALGEIPADLRDAHYEGAKELGRGLGYRWPHAFPRHWIPQEYMPTGLKGEVFYRFGDNKMEQASKAYWEALKAEVLGKNQGK
ncbi:ATPase, AAA family [Clostridiaceae bacterium JG1575]|nr:ATPase, AAA family [Clostridiaceae bacterium JG1575]